MSNTSQHDTIVTQQGSTFLWTEHYGDRRTLVEKLQPLALATAVVFLATGAAEFLSMQMAR
jgi:hypothetical protein